MSLYSACSDGKCCRVGCATCSRRRRAPAKSLLIDWSKLKNPGATAYSYPVRDAIESQLPKSIKEAMAMSGWDALGVYELVKFALAAEKRAARQPKSMASAPSVPLQRTRRNDA